MIASRTRLGPTHRWCPPILFPPKHLGGCKLRTAAGFEDPTRTGVKKQPRQKSYFTPRISFDIFSRLAQPRSHSLLARRWIVVQKVRLLKLLLLTIFQWHWVGCIYWFISSLQGFGSSRWTPERHFFLKKYVGGWRWRTPKGVRPICRYLTMCLVKTFPTITPQIHSRPLGVRHRHASRCLPKTKDPHLG